MSELPKWVQNLLPIVILLAVIGLVLWRLPKVELGHSKAFKRRRTFNWVPLGLTYAFLYFGRYNINEATSALKSTSNDDFGTIFGVGAIVYGFAFLINGPLTDKLGGRKTILIAAFGAAVSNALLGLVTYAMLAHNWMPPGGVVATFSVIYAANMYFQSFGAVSIVKVNAQWFHVRERGVLGGVFGVLISLGVYFAYDWSAAIVSALPTYFVFFIPAAVLALFFAIDLFVIRDSPSKAGFEDFDTADASSGDTGPALGVVGVFKRMITNPVIVIILSIEFCSGFLRNAIMQWGRKYAVQTGLADGSFIFDNWGLVLCVAGILGGMFAGVISDRVFGSRRGPVSAVLYGGMLIGGIITAFLLGSPALGWLVAFMSLCVIGVHGMLSGTASMDFGGKKNAGVAVGIIDGAVYLGTAAQSVLLGKILPRGEQAADPANWTSWPLAMIPITLVGFLLTTRIWNATAKPSAPAPKPAEPALEPKAG
ncbi:MAG: MFS transporter [Myxococcales bacterium]|jgi:OPA family glycerol-3-phosphate transporter-like MFS transporter